MGRWEKSDVPQPPRRDSTAGALGNPRIPGFSAASRVKSKKGVDKPRPRRYYPRTSVAAKKRGS